MTSLALTPVHLHRHWRTPLLATLGLALLLLLAYRDTAAAMVGIWIRSETFTHAFVVPPIVAWLVWRKRGELAPLQPRPVPWLLLPMLAVALLWWLGDLVSVASATQLALVTMLVASVPLVLGWQVSRVLLFPLAFMFFAVPIGEFMTPTLMHWTAEALVAGLRLTGIPVYQEGQQLVIPSGRWAVVEACSGVRYLMASFMVGSLFAYLNYNSTRKRLIFVLVSLALPVLANWLRAYIIVMLGHLSNNEIATGVDHLVYGWVFFGIVILAMFFIGARFADPDPGEAAAALAQQRAAAQPQAGVASWRPLLLAGAGMLALTWPLVLQQRAASAEPATAAVRLALPDTLGRWSAQSVAATEWVPAFANPTLRAAQAYQGAAGRVVVHLAYYRGQGRDVKLVSSANSFVDSQNNRWHVVADGSVSAGQGAAGGHWREAQVLSAEADPAFASRQRLTVWRIYWLGGPLAHSDVRAKLLQAWQGVRGEPDDGAAIHLVSDLPDNAAARQLLAQFVDENFTMLQRLLADARAGR